jgi:hypothetical protein
VISKTKIKSIFFRTLDSLPSKWGYACYHFIQIHFTAPFGIKFTANAQSYQKAKEILEANGFDCRHKTILEIGSGWMPLMPYQFKIQGQCDTVHTYDIADHYQNRYIDVLNKHYREINQLNFELSKKGLHLPDFVHYQPNSNVITSPLPEHVDLIFSRFVLEHVTPTDLLAMHNRFAQTYDSNTLILHLISPSDHRAFSDSSLSHYDFLQYSEQQWDRIQTKFDYHNRLRLPQYLAIFEQAGLEVLHLEYDCARPGTKKWDLYKRLKIHEDFAQMTDEERTAGSINVLLRKRS